MRDVSRGSFQFFSQLDAAYGNFAQQVAGKPFFIPKAGNPDKSTSITSFLCTDPAFEIFAAAKAEFDGWNQLKFPDYKPSDAQGNPVQNALTNKEVLEHLRKFFTYASKSAKRGTPHQM